MRRTVLHCCNYQGSNPNLGLGQTRRLFHRGNSCITNDPKADRIVFATARAGHWLGRGSEVHWSVDVTNHSSDRPVRAHNDRARSHYRVFRRYDPCTNYGHDRWWPWHWRWLSEDWLSLGSPALPRPQSGTKTGALGTFDTDHWAWRHPTATVRGWDTVDTSGWYHPSSDGRDEIHGGCKRCTVQTANHALPGSDDPRGFGPPRIIGRTTRPQVTGIWTTHDDDPSNHKRPVLE